MAECVTRQERRDAFLLLKTASAAAERAEAAHTQFYLMPFEKGFIRTREMCNS